MISSNRQIAIEVPGIKALNNSGDAEVTSLSCSSVDNCRREGYYLAFSLTQLLWVKTSGGGIGIAYWSLIAVLIVGAIILALRRNSYTRRKKGGW